MHNNYMQQLTIEHKNTIEKKKKDRREGKVESLPSPEWSIDYRTLITSFM